MGFAEGVRLVRLRGEAMQEAVPAGEGGMAAILGLPTAQLKRPVPKRLKAKLYLLLITTRLDRLLSRAAKRRRARYHCLPGGGQSERFRYRCQCLPIVP